MCGPELLAGAALRVVDAVLALFPFVALGLADDERAASDVHCPVKLIFCQVKLS